MYCFCKYKSFGRIGENHAKNLGKPLQKPTHLKIKIIFPDGLIGEIGRIGEHFLQNTFHLYAGRIQYSTKNCNLSDMP